MKRMTIADAPTVLNTNDKAMWVLGYNAALDAMPAVEPQLTEDEAWEIAFRAAKAFRPSYFTGNDFWPHPWVVHAVISATNAGQRAAAKGRDMFSSPRGVVGTGGEQRNG